MIKGFQPTSLVDYPGNICSVVFYGGCNMRCPYCHNSELVIGNLPTISEEEIITQIEKQQKFIDGVCITGGEPTLQPSLFSFITKIKKMGLKVKLDSNGTNPLALQKLVEADLIDFIAMDIKQLPEKYGAVTGYSNANVIAKSISYIKSCGVPYEFRTTVVPKFTKEEDILAIAQYLQGAKKYCIQQFVSSDRQFDTSITKAFTPEKLRELGNQVKPFFEKVEVRV